MNGQPLSCMHTSTVDGGGREETSANCKYIPGAMNVHANRSHVLLRSKVKLDNFELLAKCFGDKYLPAYLSPDENIFCEYYR